MNGIKKSILNEQIFWLLANALGIVIYLSLDSWIVAPRLKGDEFNGIDQFFFWIKGNLPILMLYLLLNVIWLIRIKRHYINSNKWPLRALIFTCLIWSVALIYYGFIIKFLKIVIMLTLNVTGFEKLRH